MTLLLRPLSRLFLAGKPNLCPVRSYRKSASKLELPNGRFLAYRQVPGSSQPTIVFVPGLHSYIHMKGMAAQAVLRFCDYNDYAGIIYDHEGVGESDPEDDPMKQSSLLFSHWVEDVHAVIDNLTEGPIVLVGCSTGGWIATVVAQQLKSKIHGMLLYAPALNYVYPYYQQHLAMLPKEVQKRLEQGQKHHFTSGRNMGSALLQKDFAEDSRAYEIDLDKKVDVECPIRIVHGLSDEVVPYAQTLKLCEAFKSNDVDVVFRKSGPHKLEAPMDIEIFLNTLDRMLKDHPVRREGDYQRLNRK